MEKAESSLSYYPNGEAKSFVGPDAVNMYRAYTLVSAIGLLQKGMQPTRGFTMKKALDMATGYTNKKYKRTQSEEARADVKKWADEMKAALPVVE